MLFRKFVYALGCMFYEMLSGKRPFDGEDYVLMTPQLAGIARSDLGALAGSLADQRLVILAAMDFLLTGF